MTTANMIGTEMPSPSFYEGNCHCGQIRFGLGLQQPLRRVFTCRCSICSKKGYLWIFPEESQFRITSGQQVMASYTANGRSGEHFVNSLQSLLDRSSLTLFLLVLSFVRYRDHGGESYSAGRRLKNCCERE